MKKFNILPFGFCFTFVLAACLAAPAFAADTGVEAALLAEVGFFCGVVVFSRVWDNRDFDFGFDFGFAAGAMV